ncbi:MAG: hypothetical protein ACFCUT_06700 [Kiloniellaceae bacterium]
MHKHPTETRDEPAAPTKRGRPRGALALPHQRPRSVALPFDDADSTSTPEYQAAFRRFLQWVVCAEMERNPDDRRQAFEEAVRVLHASGLQARDLLEATR